MKCFTEFVQVKLWEPPYYDLERKAPVEGNLNELAVTLMVGSLLYLHVTTEWQLVNPKSTKKSNIFRRILGSHGRTSSKD